MIRLRRSGSTPVRFRIVTSIDLTDYTATLEIGNFSAEAALDGGYGTVVVPQTVAQGLPHGKVVSTVTVKDALENTVQTLRVDTFAVDGAVFDSETEVPITLVEECNNWTPGN